MTKPTPKYSNVAIVIPAYNEAEVIKDTIGTIPNSFPLIICVDDGSRDDTAAQVEKTRAVLVKHPLNLGSGAALQTAIDYALLDPNVEYIVTFDADGQHIISDVEVMLASIKDKKVDVMLGSRFLGETVGMTRRKRTLLRLATKFSNLTSGVKLTDTHNGLRVFSRHAAELMRLNTPDFGHASEIIERIAENKLTYAESPVTIIYSDYSKRKGQPIINAINISFDTLLRRLIK